VICFISFFLGYDKIFVRQRPRSSVDRASASGAEERSSSLRGGTFCLISYIVLNVDWSSSPFVLFQTTYLLDTIRLVIYKKLVLHLILIIVCIACDSTTNAPALATSVPNFVTATLPPTPTLSILPTLTILPINPSDIAPSPVVQLSLVEGTTTAQVNVRAETSTASASLGIVAAFSKIQVIGKEASGNWYRVQYLESTGWVRAEFVQVDVSAEVAVVAIESNHPVGGSGVVTSGINVRNGAGTEYESLGVLIKGDVVWVLGKDATNAWLQIDFMDGMGWVSSDFLQVDSLITLPVVTTSQRAEPTLAIDLTNKASSIPMLVAMQDNDSMQTPLFNIFLGSKKSFQITGEVSAPLGDMEDWVGFSASSSKLVIELSCSGDGLQVELWQAGFIVETYLTPCNRIFFIDVASNKNYSFRIFQQNDNYVSYSLKVQRMN
jgi:uncharacterized protein YraI